MNREDIIRMALEAGIDYGFGAELERFAALVAAHEREACAQICDTESADPMLSKDNWKSADESSFWEKSGWAHACGNCAAVIRARGEK